MKTAFITYQETKAEYEILKKRYDYLEGKKESLYQRLLGLHSPALDSEGSKGNGNSDLGSKVAQYNFEIEEKKQRNGKTIKEEQEELFTEMLGLESLLAKFEVALSSLTGIEHQLFYKIAVDGLNPNRAVAEVAESNQYSERQIWRAYNTARIYLQPFQRQKKGQGE